jgi:GTPase SAR1 family protein
MDGKVEEDFETWWHNEGSKIQVEEGLDEEESMYAVSKIAWLNGAFKANNVCNDCSFYDDGYCYEKISKENAEEDEESWENLERYFKKKKTDYCSSFNGEKYVNNEN